jgi:uncharacterized protein YjeT (DUF2065 family)
MEYFIILLGLVALFQGLPQLISPDSVRARAKRLMQADDKTHRFAGALTSVLALVLFYLAL